MNKRLITVKSESNIPVKYLDTAIEKLLKYHNLNFKSEGNETAELLTVMCMDNRQMMRLPRNFSFYIRNAGGRVSDVSFSISFAIAVGGVQAIAVIGHNDCRMVGLEAAEEAFRRGLSERGGWEAAEAGLHFSAMCPAYKKDDVIESVISDVKLLRSGYPNIIVAPLFYNVDDGLLYLVKES